MMSAFAKVTSCTPTANGSGMVTLRCRSSAWRPDSVAGARQLRAPGREGSSSSTMLPVASAKRRELHVRIGRRPVDELPIYRVSVRVRYRGTQRGGLVHLQGHRIRETFSDVGFW